MPLNRNGGLCPSLEKEGWWTGFGVFTTVWIGEIQCPTQR